MRPRANRLFLTALLGALLALPAAAQDGRDRVEEELRRTDDGLDRAREIVVESTSQRARDLLENAFRIQENAWTSFREDRPLVAANLTREARNLGLRAVTLAREDRSLRNRAQREGEKAERALNRAREQLGDNPDPQAIRLLEEAQAQIQRARVQFGEQHFEAALRLAVSAQRLIKQAVGASTGHGGGERVRRELERTDRLIERVSSVLRDTDNPEALRLLDRGRDLQRDAWNALRAGRPRVALAKTQEARGLVNRAHSLVRGPVDRASVDQALGETERVLDRAAERVRESRVERAREVLDKAREHQSRAVDLAGAGQLRRALAETRVARNLAMRAIRLAEEVRP